MHGASFGFRGSGGVWDYIRGLMRGLMGVVRSNPSDWARREDELCTWLCVFVYGMSGEESECLW